MPGENDLLYLWLLHRLLFPLKEELCLLTGSWRRHGGTPERSRPNRRSILTDKRRAELAEAGPLGKPLHGNGSERFSLFSRQSKFKKPGKTGEIR